MHEALILIEEFIAKKKWSDKIVESMKKFIKLYSQIMTDDGILIIEDVQDWKWIDILKNQVPESLKSYVKVYDLRKNKGRYDDIVFTIDKSSAL